MNKISVRQVIGALLGLGLIAAVLWHFLPPVLEIYRSAGMSWYLVGQVNTLLAILLAACIPAHLVYGFRFESLGFYAQLGGLMIGIHFTALWVPSLYGLHAGIDLRIVTFGRLILVWVAIYAALQILEPFYTSGKNTQPG